MPCSLFTDLGTRPTIQLLVDLIYAGQNRHSADSSLYVQCLAAILRLPVHQSENNFLSLKQSFADETNRIFFQDGLDWKKLVKDHFNNVRISSKNRKFENLYFFQKKKSWKTQFFCLKFFRWSKLCFYFPEKKIIFSWNFSANNKLQAATIFKEIWNMELWNNLKNGNCFWKMIFLINFWRKMKIFEKIWKMNFFEKIWKMNFFEKIWKMKIFEKNWKKNV